MADRGAAKQERWHVGRLSLDRPVMLAPMEGHSDAAFRRVCRTLGADLTFTEFTAWQQLSGRPRRPAHRHARGRRKIQLFDDERPVGIQLYGRDPQRMAEAARLACAEDPEVVDVNFGCPAKGGDGGRGESGCGSQLMREPTLLLEVASAVVVASTRPVTCKLRLGWDHASINVVELALRLQDLGVAGLTVHGRTRCQRYEGEADWDWIARVAAAVDLPVVGNGDLRSAGEAARRQRESGVAGLMIGRAALEDPWIFGRVRAELDGLPAPPEPGWPERISLCRLHLARSLEDWGPDLGLRRMRGRYGIYLGAHPDFASLRRGLVRLSEPAAVWDRLERLEQAAACPPGPASTTPLRPATNCRARARVQIG